MLIILHAAASHKTITSAHIPLTIVLRDLPTMIHFSKKAEA